MKSSMNDILQITFISFSNLRRGRKVAALFISATMSHMIVKRITITSDLRVMVRMAANNLRPLDFRCGEVEPLTETLRTKGRPALEMELLSLFFYGTWQGRNRYSRAVGYALFTDNADKYEAWKRCWEDKAYEWRLLLRMRGFLHYCPVPCPCRLEYRGHPVRQVTAGGIFFSRKQYHIFPSILDAQVALFEAGRNPEEFRIVEEKDNHPQNPK